MPSGQRKPIYEKFFHSDKKKWGQNRKSISSVMLWIITTDTLRCYTQFAPPDTLQTDKASETELCGTGWDVQFGY